MSNHSLPERILFDIGSDLRIGLKGRQTWQVWARNGCFDLVEVRDFWRVLILLERPYVEVESAINKFAAQQGAEGRFPLWKIVGVGLESQSVHWVPCALEWFPSLADEEKILLKDFLKEVRGSKWVSQKSRQLADLYLKGIAKLGRPD